jgi:hypothetical protein
VTSLGDFAFSPCGSLASIYFLGNPPAADSTVFSDSNPTAYYLPGASGWSSNYDGLSTTICAAIF